MTSEQIEALTESSGNRGQSTDDRICEHLTFVLDARGQGRPVVLQCAYCPLCGKNLTCLHYGIDGGGTDYYGTSNPAQEADWNFKHCPSCGEQL